MPQHIAKFIAIIDKQDIHIPERRNRFPLRDACLLSNGQSQCKVEPGALAIFAFNFKFTAHEFHKRFRNDKSKSCSAVFTRNGTVRLSKRREKPAQLLVRHTDTRIDQWGTALSMASAFFGIDCQVYMVKVSYEQKPFRREVMRTYGASVTPSPSMTTDIGKKINAEFPGTTGSLGCAISEAVEAAVKQEGYRYVLGSVLNQVLLHQSVIGLETKAALDKIGVKADLIIGCAGGGSNLGGLVSPFVGEKLRGEADYDILAVEPASCPSFTRGKYAYDFCDTGKVCPLAKMYTLGSSFIPSANHAGGLRYHGMSSILSELYDQGLMR